MPDIQFPNPHTRDLIHDALKKNQGRNDRDQDGAGRELPPIYFARAFPELGGCPNRVAALRAPARRREQAQVVTTKCALKIDGQVFLR